MIEVFYFIIGCFTNRFVRGGDIAKRTESDLAKHYPLHKKLIEFVVSADFLNFLVFSISLGILGVFPAWQVVLISIAMWLGAAPTLGQYMGAFLNGEKFEKFTRNKIFDFVPNLIIGRDIELAGFVGLLIRGMFWGGVLSFASWTLAPLLVGIFMPSVYYLAQKISEKIGYQSGWTIGEFIFGGVLWISVLI